MLEVFAGVMDSTSGGAQREFVITEVFEMRFQPLETRNTNHFKLCSVHKNISFPDLISGRSLIRSVQKHDVSPMAKS